jgi:hypothetical protein
VVVAGAFAKHRYVSSKHLKIVVVLALKESKNQVWAHQSQGIQRWPTEDGSDV